MEVSWIWQCNAMAASVANSTALRFRTGKAPGRPRQTGHTLVLGGSPKRVEQEQKILEAVSNWTCTSRRRTVPYLGRAAMELSGMVTIFADYSHCAGPVAGSTRQSGNTRYACVRLSAEG